MGVFEQLIEVQDLDLAIDQRRHRIERHPARDAVSSAEAELARLDGEVAAVGAERDGVRAEQGRLEREVAAVEAKAATVSGQLYGGSVTAHKDLEALQHELATLADLQRGAEDRVIEQMELAEPLEDRLADLAVARDQAEEALRRATAELAEAVADLQEELDGLLPRREQAAAAVPADLLEDYERIRARSGGIGAARLVGGRCEGCHLSLPAVDVDTIRKMSTDERVECPECGRLLVR